MLTIVVLSFVGAVMAGGDIPSTSTCLLNTFPESFKLVPVNLYPETDVVGPTSLNAENFVTLGLPVDSEFGAVTTETFSLQDGWLSEEGGLQVYFDGVEGLAGNEDGVTQSSVLKAGECFEESSFCVDGDGYLVSVTPVVAGDGTFVAGRIKFYACPNEEQDTFGGGEYKIFSNNGADVDNCFPIYLGVKGIAAEPEEPPCTTCDHAHQEIEVVPPLVTQIWDGQVQAPVPAPIPPKPVPTCPCDEYPAPYPCSPYPCPATSPAPCPAPCPVPVPPPCAGPEPCPPFVTEIFDGQLQAPPTPEPCPPSQPCPAAVTPTAVPAPPPVAAPAPIAPPPIVPAPAPISPVPAPQFPASPPAPAPVVPPTPAPAPVAPPPASPSVFQGSAPRIALDGFAGWIALAAALKLLF